MKKIIRKTWKILRWPVYLFTGLIVLLLVAMESLDRYIATEQGARWVYKNIPCDSVEINYTDSGLRYLSIGDPDKQPLVLVYGAPGTIFDWTNTNVQSGEVCQSGRTAADRHGLVTLRALEVTKQKHRIALRLASKGR